MLNKKNFIFYTIIIVLFIGLFQPVLSFSTKWAITLTNSSTKELLIDSISPQGFHFQLPFKDKIKKGILPHQAIKEAIPTQSFKVKVTLKSLDSNNVLFLGIEDSNLQLAGQNSNNQWLSLTIPNNMVKKLELDSNEAKSLNIKLKSWDFKDSFDLLIYSESPLDTITPNGLAINPTTVVSVEKKPTIVKPKKSVPKIQNSLEISTVNPGAHIFLNGLPTLQNTPFTFKNIPVGDYNYETRWTVNNNLWAFSDSINIKQSTQAFKKFKTQRVRPELNIQSTPPGAFIFFHKPNEHVFKSKWTTPLAIADINPGIRQITIKANGFKDSTFYLNVLAGQKSIADINLIQHSKLQTESRSTQNKWSKNLIWTSVPAFALASTFHALAEMELKNAWKSKILLSQPSFQKNENSNFKDLKKENRTSVEDAKDLYMASQIFVGIAIILGGVGLTLHF